MPLRQGFGSAPARGAARGRLVAGGVLEQCDLGDQVDVGAHGARGRAGVAGADGLGDLAVAAQRAGWAALLGQRLHPRFADRGGDRGHQVGQQLGVGRGGDRGVEALVALEAPLPRSICSPIRSRAVSIWARSWSVRRWAASSAMWTSRAMRASITSGRRRAWARKASRTVSWGGLARRMAPLPWRTSTTPWTSRATRAWRRVARLTSRAAASSRSGGKRSPGARWSSWTRARRRSTSCSYSRGRATGRSDTSRARAGSLGPSIAVTRYPPSRGSRQRVLVGTGFHIVSSAGCSTRQRKVGTPR